MVAPERGWGSLYPDTCWKATHSPPLQAYSAQGPPVLLLPMARLRLPAEVTVHSGVVVAGCPPTSTTPSPQPPALTTEQLVLALGTVGGPIADPRHVEAQATIAGKVPRARRDGSGACAEAPSAETPLCTPPPWGVPLHRLSLGSRHRGSQLHWLTAAVLALVRAVAALRDTITEVSIGETVGAVGTGEVSGLAAASTAQLITAIAAVGLAIAEPAPRRTLSAAAREGRGAACRCCGQWVTMGCPCPWSPPCAIPVQGPQGAVWGFGCPTASLPLTCRGVGGGHGSGQCCCAPRRALIPAIAAVTDTITNRSLTDAGAIRARELPRGAGHPV